MHFNDTDLMSAYLATWTSPTPTGRRAAVDELWDDDGHLTVSSTGQSLIGRDAITRHIDSVHETLIVGRGLQFTYDQSLWSGDTMLLRWSMTGPDGSVAGRGVDTLRFTEDGHISTANMFMGVN